MSEGVAQSKSLFELLELAAAGDAGWGEAFYRKLLASDVYLALDPTVKTDLPLVGQSSIDAIGGTVVEIGSEEFVPIFTDQDAADLWRGDTQLTRVVPFRALLELLHDELWLHLNPGSEIGKEFTPWEISLLRNGEESIAEVVSEVFEAAPPDLELEPDWNDVPEFIARLRSTAESYPDVLELFVVGVREIAGVTQDKAVFSPVIGIKHRHLDAEKISQLVDEINDLSQVILPVEYKTAIVSDVEYKGDPRTALFRSVKPIYFAPRYGDQVENESPLCDSSVIGRVLSKLRRSDRKADKKAEKEG